MVFRVYQFVHDHDVIGKQLQKGIQIVIMS